MKDVFQTNYSQYLGRFLNYLSSLLFIILFNLYPQISPQQPPSLKEYNQQLVQESRPQSRKAMEGFGVVLEPTRSEGYKPYEIPQVNKDEKRKSDLRQILDELKREHELPKNKAHPLETKLKLIDTNSVLFKQKANYYYKSFNGIVRMLEGKDSLDIKKAIWLSERPTYPNISYQQFCNWVKEALWAFQYIKSKDGIKNHRPDDLHHILRKIYQDTLKILKPQAQTFNIFYPYQYDFKDPMGDKNKFNYTVAKLLQKHTGQCH